MTDTFDTSFERLLRAFNSYSELRSRHAPLPELIASAEELYAARSGVRAARCA